MTNPPQGQPPEGQFPQEQQPQQSSGGQPPQFDQQRYDPNQQAPNYPQGQHQGQWGYPQQQPGYPQGAYPPPNQKKTGLWIGVGVAIVVIAALLITGFVAPGFFLSKDDNKAAQPPASSAPSKMPGTGSSSSPSARPASGDADAVAKDLVAKLNANDSAGALALACDSTDPRMTDVIGRIVGQNPQLSAGPVEKVGDNLSGAALNGSVGGKQLPGKQPAGQSGSAIFILEHTLDHPCIFGIALDTLNP